MVQEMAKQQVSFESQLKKNGKKSKIINMLFFITQTILRPETIKFFKRFFFSHLKKLI